MASSGQTARRHPPRRSNSARSICSGSTPNTSSTPLPSFPRSNPGRTTSTRDGILPLPTAERRFEVAPTPSHGTLLNGHKVGADPHQIITIPSHIIQATHKKLFGNKVFLAFESEFDSRRTLNWLAAFNQESSIPLTLSDVLNNSLFVVQFDAALGLENRDLLLQRSPLKALDCFAAVNPYRFRSDYST